MSYQGSSSQQGSDLQEDHCLPPEQQLNASQSRRLQKSQSAHIKSHGFSLFLSFFSIIQRSVEGGYHCNALYQKGELTLDKHFVVQKWKGKGGLLKFLVLIGFTHEQ